MRVFVAGHTGLVGRATHRALLETNHEVWIPDQRYDFREQVQARHCLNSAKRAGVDTVVLAAARVGGIGANSTYPADFLYDNITISTHIIVEAFRAEIPRLLNLGSSCIYPREAQQPMKEEALLTGALEPTNEAYAIAKISALKLVQAFRRQHGARYISLMPTNLYGDDDKYDAERSHVIPSLVLKFERARREHTDVTLWGTGQPLREFLHVQDLARAIVLALEVYDDDLWLNVGSDQEVSIAELAQLVKQLTNFEGDIVWDRSKPDGMPRKKLDWSRLRQLGWTPKISLKEGLWRTIQSYRARSE